LLNTSHKNAELLSSLLQNVSNDLQGLVEGITYIVAKGSPGEIEKSFSKMVFELPNCLVVSMDVR